MTLRLNGSTSGYVELDAPAVAGSTSIVIPATSGNLITTGDTNTVTAAMMNTEGVSLNTGYIKSRSAGVNPTNAATNSDFDHQPFTPTLSVDMGTPININTIYDITAECQLHFDTAIPGNTNPDPGGYGGLGIQVQINGGSWTTIRSTGRWGAGDAVEDDTNTRLFIRTRYKLSGWTTGDVVFRAVWSSHRNQVFFGRVPSSTVGPTTQLHVFEYNVGETS